MSTRCLIGYQDEEDGPVWAIYCHHDGYRNGVGKTLVDHWNDPVDIEHLIEGGAISSLGKDLGDTIFYIRDRNERATRSNSAQPYQDIEKLRRVGLGDFGHVYLHTPDRGWLVADDKTAGGRWEPLFGSTAPRRHDESEVAYVQRAFLARLKHEPNATDHDAWLLDMLRKHVTDDRRRISSLSRMILSKTKTENPSAINESFDRLQRLAGIKKD